jgi:hypothetical protein
MKGNQMLKEYIDMFKFVFNEIPLHFRIMIIAVFALVIGFGIFSFIYTANRCGLMTTLMLGESGFNIAYLGLCD